MKVLATMAFGPESNAILDLTLPNFQRYADRHGYTTLVMRGEGENSISHSWKKLDLMLGALEYADNVLFLDADVKIEDDSEDIAVFVPKDKWMGMVFENDGPNAGVMYCRRIGSGILKTCKMIGEEAPASFEWEAEQWALRAMTGHRNSDMPQIIVDDMQRLIHPLDWEWNNIDGEGRVRFRHYAGLTFEEKYRRLSN